LYRLPETAVGLCGVQRDFEMSDYQWLINNGFAVAIVAFTGFVLYRVLVGSKATGYQGLLIRWANGLSNEIHSHTTEAKSEFDKSTAQHAVQVSALQLLVEANAPPIGAAFIAARTVHETAANVERLITDLTSAKAAMVEITKLSRKVAHKMPDLEADIDQHCEAIERLLK